MSRCATVAVLAGACLACTSSGPDAPELVNRSERDGVAVVENLAAALEAAATWTVDPIPELSIGVAQGPEELQLFRVMDTATVDERVVVVNAGTRELRWFDHEGRFLSSSGRAGEGPGEFGFPLHLWVRDGGSIAVWDPTLQRLSMFDSGGSFDRMVVPRPSGGSQPDMVALFADGGFVLTDWQFAIPEEGFAQSTLELSLHAPGGERVATLGSWANGRMGRLDPLPQVGRYIFDPSTHATGTAGALWVGNGGEPEVVRFAARGQRELIVRWPAEHREVEPRHVDAYYRASAENEPDEADLEEQMRKVRPVADRLPEFGALVGAETGRLWVMRYRPPGEDGDVAWLVFEEDGRLAARAVTPAGFAPFEIGDDYVLGASMDEGGFERVVMYRIRREGASAR